MQHPDVICFSHLRWDFVFQRPNHLMCHFAEEHRVFYFEEPVVGEGDAEVFAIGDKLLRVVPKVPRGCSPVEAEAALRAQLIALCEEQQIVRPILWFYTPMYVTVARGLAVAATVYDCMDELANFKFAPRELCERERELMARADLVFTGGRALYEAKRDKHRNVHAMPSSVDVAFFERARASLAEPTDQAGIPHPRIGYAGVIDERIDLDLLSELADSRPDWHFVMLGPLAKVSWEDLPQRPNLHYLGLKAYEQLPSYVAGWDVAMMPFALNDATRYISPTKTPEYLAAGRPVVSTAITDVVDPYGKMGLVRIARSTAEFLDGIEASLSGIDRASAERRDAFLAGTSWRKTYEAMRSLVRQACSVRFESGVSHPGARTRSSGLGEDHV